MVSKRHRLKYYVMKNRKFNLMALLAVSIPLNASVSINELMVRNASYQVNENFNFEGWVELYNSGSESVDLSNCFFSDSKENLYRWQNKKNIVLQPKAFTIFYFDELDTLNHAGFKLDSDGGELFLSDENGNLLDELKYPKPFRNASFGRVTDGGDDLSTFIQPTMEASNNDSKTTDYQTSAPIFSITGGFFTSEQMIEIETEDVSAKIFYTTDGSEPTPQSTLYTSPVRISTVTPLRAIAVVDGEVASDITTATYFVGLPGIPTSTKVVSLVTDNEYFFGDQLGCIAVGTNGLDVPTGCSGHEKKANYMRDWDRPCNFEVFDEDNVSRVNQEVKVGAFGACSRTKAIKSIKVKANKVSGDNHLDYAMFSEKPNLKWKSVILRNSGNDFGRMLFRDGFLQYLAASKMDLDHQAYEPSVVFINGEYYAFLGIRERSNKDFIYSNYGLDEGEFCIEESPSKVVECDNYQEFLDLANSADMNAAGMFDDIDKLIDVDEFLNYFMTEIYYCNQDWSAGNIKAWRRNENGKWRWILYDTDFSTSLYSDYLSTNGFTYAERCKFFPLIMRNDELKRRLITKFVAHAGTTFEREYVSQVIDSMKAIMVDEADYYFAMLKSQKVHEKDSWHDEVEKVRNFLDVRPEFLFGHIANNYRLDNPVPLRIFSDVKGASYVLNGCETVRKDDFRSKYFRNYDLSVEALAPDGWKFDHWDICEENYLIKANDSWKYLYQTNAPDDSWRELSFNDADWKTGEAPLGAGLNSQLMKTSIASGNMGGGFFGGGKGLNNLTYLRKTVSFSADDIAGFDDELLCDIHVNDGAIIYLNGKEIYRFNVPEGNVHDTIPAIYEMDSYAHLRFSIQKTDLLEGDNVIAVQLRNALKSSTLVFDLSLMDPKSGVEVISSSKDNTYTSKLGDGLVLRAVYEKDPDWNENDVRLYINEVCAANKQYVDEYRKDKDWIEIYNDGSTPVDLSGMYLSDKRTDLKRYQIPSGEPSKTIVPAKGYLIFWADADTLNERGANHTNFELKKEKGQTISLSRRVGDELEVIDSVRYLPHDNGASFSRFSYSGDGAWTLTSVTTLGKRNKYAPAQALPDRTIAASEEAIPFHLYPNPAEDYVWFSYPQDGKCFASLSDMSGRVVLQQYVENGGCLNVSSLKADVYVVNVAVNGKLMYKSLLMKM